MHALEAQVAGLSHCKAVWFHGFLPQVACAPVLTGADALCLNSVWEYGGAVVLEAMGLGLPEIGADCGGPTDYLNKTCGILVAPTPRATYADRLTEATTRLARDPTLCTRMGAAGAAKVREQFEGERKVDQLLEIYVGVLAPAE